MKRRLLLGVLALGSVLGYSSALCSWHHGRHAHRAHWEQRVADVCVRAAHGVQNHPNKPALDR